MLMYGKEASNRKQEIDRQHYTIPNQRPNGQLHGNYGHSRNYWTRPGNLQAEAFAHFFEASMGDQGKLELLANFFPTAFGIFSSMIDSIRPDNHVRVLSRER